MMSDTNQTDPQNSFPDPFLDEVRALRRAVVAEFDNDVHKLCAHLRDVQREYETRTGRFADLSTVSADDVTAQWGTTESRAADAR